MTLVVVHSEWRWGGSEMVAARLAEAFAGDYRVHLASLADVDLEAVDAYYGTSLAHTGVEVVGPLWGRLLAPERAGFWLLSQHGMMRWCRNRYSDADLIISATNEFYCNHPTVQYVHYPAQAIAWKEYVAGSQNGSLPRYLLGQIYRGGSYLLSGYMPQKTQKNTTVVNSRWTQEQYKKYYGTTANVVYPPVEDDFPAVKWQEKEDGFIWVGRVTESKKTDKALQIIEAVRARGFDVHLHIVGPNDSSEYSNRVTRRCRKHDWLTREGRVSRERYNELLATHRYGLHTMKDEHFGVGVAEMAIAGAVPFVYEGGGQTEVVGTDELMYRTKRDAVETICRILARKESLTELRRQLNRRVARFSVEKFESEMRNIVKDRITSVS